MQWGPEEKPDKEFMGTSTLTFRISFCFWGFFPDTGMHLGTMVIVFFFSIENPKPTALLQSLKVNAEAAVNWKINSWEYQLLVCGYCEMIKIWFKLVCFLGRWCSHKSNLCNVHANAIILASLSRRWYIIPYYIKINKIIKLCHLRNHWVSSIMTKKA